jgi:hypothetical protein
MCSPVKSSALGSSKALGLAVTQTLLATADEVIE